MVKEHWPWPPLIDIQVEYLVPALEPPRVIKALRRDAPGVNKAYSRGFQ